MTADQKELAVNISRVLAESKDWIKNSSVGEVIKKVVATLDSLVGLKVEYYEIVDGYTLQSVSDWKDSDYIVGCIAIFCGEVRLIDNIIYKANSQN